MGQSPKPKLNPRLVKPINRGSFPHFQHSASPEFRAQTTKSIYLPSENDKKLQSFREESTTYRSRVRSIQSSSTHSATFEIKRSYSRITQVIRILNQRIITLNSEIVLTFNINHIQH